MQQDILQQIHAGHQGAEKCKLRARSCVFRTSMTTDIDKVVHQCATRQEHQCAQPAETLRPHEIPTRPWQVVGSDLFYYDGHDHLIVADYYSKFLIVRKIPMGHCTSQTVVSLTKQIFSEHGIPQRVVTDNGPQYDSETYRKFAKEWCFDHVTSSPHYPKSNVFIERTQTVKMTLKKAKSFKLDPYLALLCIRPTPVDNVLPSPAEMLYTRKVQGNLTVRMRNKLGNKEEIYERLQQRQEFQTMISTLVICHHCFQDRTSEYSLFHQVCGHLQWYGRNVRNRVPMLWKHKMEGCCEEIGDTYE